MLDQGIYPVTLAATLFDSPQSITCRSRVQEGLDLTTDLTFRYDDGRFAQLAASMDEFIDPSASINGTMGWITIPFPFWALTGFSIHRPSPTELAAERTITLAREGNGYVPMLRSASEAILASRQEHPWHTWEQTLEIARLLDDVRGRAGAER